MKTKNNNISREGKSLDEVLNEEGLSKNTVEVEPYPSKDEENCDKVGCPTIEALKNCTKEEINNELRERSEKARVQQNVDKVVVEYFKRHGTTYIINGAVCSSLRSPRTLEECVELFKDCDPAIIDELISLYAIIEQQKLSDARREGYSSACKTFSNVTRYK